MSNFVIIQGEGEAKRGVRYEVDSTLDPIGKGGTGVVRKGIMVDERTGVRRDVAIKFLYDDMPENMLVRSQREASIRIVSENLVEMIDFVRTTEKDVQGRTIVHSHVVSELLHGVMLLDLLKGTVCDREGAVIPAAKKMHDLMLTDRNRFAINIVRNVLSGIMALHDNGYIHRDIDPSNIMITDRGKVKLIDLGIAKKLKAFGAEEQHLTSTGQFIGKAAYAAPELVLGDLPSQNETTDIYAIGIMLYLLLTNKLPFNGSLQDILYKQCHEKMPVEVIKDKNIRKIIKKATEKRQADRYQSAAEFRVAIDGIKSSVASTPVQSTLSEAVLPQTNEQGTKVSDSSNAAMAGTVVSNTIVSTADNKSVVSSVAPQNTSLSSAKPTVSTSKLASHKDSSSNKKTILTAAILAAVIVLAGIAGILIYNNSSPSVDEDNMIAGGGGGSATISELVEAEPIQTTSPQETETASDVENAESQISETQPQAESQKSLESATQVTETKNIAQATASKEAPVNTSKVVTSAKESVPTKETTAVKEKTPAKEKTAASDGMTLSYGKYTGSVKGGYPNGKGKLVYTTSRQINKYDPKGRTAEAGDYVEGMFVNGFFTTGKHYNSSGELIGKISVGVAEGVFESK